VIVAYVDQGPGHTVIRFFQGAPDRTRAHIGTLTTRSGQTGFTEDWELVRALHDGGVVLRLPQDEVGSIARRRPEEVLR
jgi:hypothetical protein